MNIEELVPAERRAAEGFLERNGEQWRGGRTFLARRDGVIAGMARLLEPNAGDGHHREHVRELVACGEDEALAPLADAAMEAAGPMLRVEATCTEGRVAWEDALNSCGLELEARLPQSWSEDDGIKDRLLFGRAAPDRRETTASTVIVRPATPAPVPLRMQWADETTRAALRRFLLRLVPGRAYPPGTMLSESERLETQRNKAADAPWLLALDDAGEIAGALVLERDRAPQRAHVRRLHLDVLRERRECGIARGLVKQAIADASRFGVTRLEADPRAGNVGACSALSAGGMKLAGTQVAAWRLRGPLGTWDEDVAWYSAAVRPAPS